MRAVPTATAPSSVVVRPEWNAARRLRAEGVQAGLVEVGRDGEAQKERSSTEELRPGCHAAPWALHA